MRPIAPQLVLTAFSPYGKYAATGLKTTARWRFGMNRRREDRAQSLSGTNSVVRSAQQRSALAVKKLIPSAFSIAVLAGLLSVGSTAWSQSEKPGRASAKDAAEAKSLPHKVGLIDMAHVFKHYKKFEYLREDLKLKIGDSEAQAKKMAEDIKALQSEMKELKEGSPEFGVKEQKLAKASAEFETFRRSTQREILKEESQIYHQIYMEVADAVKKYSKFYKYTLVLRFNREDLNPEDPQGLIQGMNRQVVFHQEEDDMTNSVLQHLNDKFDEGQGGKPAKQASGEKKPRN